MRFLWDVRALCKKEKSKKSPKSLSKENVVYNTGNYGIMDEGNQDIREA